MKVTADQFILDSETKAFDLFHRDTINFNISRYDTSVQQGLSRFFNLENSKKRAYTHKWKAIENLDRYLLEFEQNFTRRGGKVIWANSDAEAREEILQIARRHQVKTAVKSKSMATEEIELNGFLKENGIESFETDLGEYIVQLLGQRPYHIVTPAMHLRKEEIAQLFHEKFGTPLHSSPEEITQKARELLREKYIQADLGITGANFIIADTGSIAITENEGNARLSMTFPRVHIALVGIEKVLPNLADLDLFWPLLATHGTGQNLTVYNSILSGPKGPGELDGPEHMYVILLDNGRTDLLGKKELRQGLYCIRCGACLNACPVYKNIGGHTYETTYSGPIGSVITPHLKGMEQFKHLSQASTLCGNCSTVCPVKIDLHKMLLINRRESVDKGFTTRMEKWGWNFWKRGMVHQNLLDQVPSSWKRYFLKFFFNKSWGKRRKLPPIAPVSFHQLWNQQHPASKD
jgi:L-lactate dehydrogenase complex protein LldF